VDVKEERRSELEHGRNQIQPITPNEILVCRVGGEKHPAVKNVLKACTDENIPETVVRGVIRSQVKDW